MSANETTYRPAPTPAELVIESVTAVALDIGAELHTHNLLVAVALGIFDRKQEAHVRAEIVNTLNPQGDPK